MDICKVCIPDKSPLQDWEYMLKNWVTAIESLCQSMPDKAPYWHNESSNVSILSGAAWRSGWFAIEEMPTKKSNLSDKYPNGRLDLWLYSSIESQMQFAIECKMGWSSLDNIDNGVKQAECRLQKACDAASHVRLPGVSYRVGVVFVSLKLA